MGHLANDTNVSVNRIIYLFTNLHAFLIIFLSGIHQMINICFAAWLRTCEHIFAHYVYKTFFQSLSYFSTQKYGNTQEFGQNIIDNAFDMSLISQLCAELLWQEANYFLKG